VVSFPELSFEPMEGERLLLTLGGGPDALDTEKGTPPPLYRALAHLLESFLYEVRANRFRLDRENLRRWIRHLTRPTDP